MRYGVTGTPRDLVRGLIAPDATDDEIDFLLWECSCFPFGSVGRWLGQVRFAVAHPRDARGRFVKR